jgi:hypothetical protein
MVALDWTLYAGDKTWFKKLAGWLHAELGLLVTSSLDLNQVSIVPEPTKIRASAVNTCSFDSA